MYKENIEAANIRITEEWHDEKWAWETFMKTENYNPNKVYITYPLHDYDIITILEIIM